VVCSVAARRSRHMLFGVLVVEIRISSHNRLPSGEPHANLAELHLPCTVYMYVGMKHTYRVLKIHIVAISGGPILDAARWKLLHVCGERDKAFPITTTTTTAHALLPLISGTVVFPKDLCFVHTDLSEETLLCTDSGNCQEITRSRTKEQSTGNAPMKIWD
jgi:hypothetical protein